MASRRVWLAASILALLVGAAEPCCGQMVSTFVNADLVRSRRFQKVESFSVRLVGAWKYEDRERLERFARAEARRLLPGIVYRASEPEGKDGIKARKDGTHLTIQVEVQLAVPADPNDTYTAALVDSHFYVVMDEVSGEGEKAGKLLDLSRTKAHALAGVPRHRLTEAIEKGITDTCQVLADGFFESR